MAPCKFDVLKVKPWSQDWLIAAGAYPGFCSMKRLEVTLLPLDGMLVHRRPLPPSWLGFPQQFDGTHLYTWVERGTVRVMCLAPKHNIMSPARARTRTARSGIERTNHEATAPPTMFLNRIIFLEASLLGQIFVLRTSNFRDATISRQFFHRNTLLFK